MDESTETRRRTVVSRGWGRGAAGYCLMSRVSVSPGGSSSVIGGAALAVQPCGWARCRWAARVKRSVSCQVYLSENKSQCTRRGPSISEQEPGAAPAGLRSRRARGRELPLDRGREWRGSRRVWKAGREVGSQGPAESDQATVPVVWPQSCRESVCPPLSSPRGPPSLLKAPRNRSAQF